MQQFRNSARKTAPAKRQAKSAMALPPSRNPQVRNTIDMVKQCIARRDVRTAGQLINKLLEVEPRNPEVHFLAAVLSEVTGNMVQAVAAYGKVLELKPNFLPALVNCAAALADDKRPLEALKLYRRAYASAPDEIAVRKNMAKTLEDLKRFEEAVSHRQWLARKTGHMQDLISLAKTLDQAGKPQDAKATFAEALKAGMSQEAIYVHMAFVELMRGNKDAAHPFLDKAIEIQPDDGHARMLRAKFYLDEMDVEAERDLVEGFLPPPANRSAYARAALYNAFALLNQKLGDVDAAFKAFADGNALVDKWHDNDQEREQTIDKQKEVLTEWRHQHPDKLGLKTEKPVFVTGLPRSSTTLVEQIISSHSQASGSGELELVPALVNSLSPLEKQRFEAAAQAYLDADALRNSRAQRVVDKSLSSWEVAGAILTMFPNARIIDCQRHPLDVCWSAFTELFNQDALIYTYSFERLAWAYKRHEKLIRHWQEAAPENIIRVRYEEIIKDPGAQARRLIGFIGLDWEDQCLDFMNSSREVRTASMMQVRQSIYSSSVGRWKKYEKQLQPLADLLRDEIEQYEKA